ncbi:hypothetical protein P152DRAFT_449926 [Eremomyces bilateralis CBS 781.70]|uniref:RNA-binding domain-containing protein n=1 Tax=Eremomyces bilateralis CBS 781.70 TaxID=1392243 RepID=A0A6G1G0K7_9PEZI|nr:uncharacterized protein P152DRAFT_449926 [Eremomyces bilateralis CBS 781.70]KAF1811645.1 hypothetical protein P152DRAFT_449926 [Eremomyces bilateralis CBS 781.70]
MRVEEENTATLKKWIIKRLEDISDADSDVLADYVLALVKSEEPDDQVRQNCLENLEDFLHDHTATFVNDVLSAIRTQSYNPEAQPPSTLSASAAEFNPPAGPSGVQNRPASDPFQNGHKLPDSRKRAFGDREGSIPRDGRDPHYHRNGDRNIKQLRRGGFRGNLAAGGDGRGRFSNQRGQIGHLGNPAMQGMPPGMQLPGMPLLPTPPGFPQFDPNNPLSAMMAMQALTFAGMQQQGAPNPLGQGQFGQLAQIQKKGRCREFDQKGFCTLGSSCSYEHVDKGADEYDPTNASIVTNTHRPNGTTSTRGQHGGRGRGRGDKQGRGRAPFSSVGPNYDQTVTTIVVEQIPEEKFTEEAVRSFFSEYGAVESIDMQPYKRLALVKFSDFASALQAYQSPKSVFDNRFVKVYWYKPDDVGINGTKDSRRSYPDEMVIDATDIAEKQAEAQRAHEEKLKKLEEAKVQREELDRKLRAQEEERKKLLAKLEAKAAATGTPAPEGSTEKKADASTDGVEDMPRVTNTETEALRAKLKELEAEATSMGIDPELSMSSPFGFGRGGPSFRGRGPRGGGGYAPRGRGYDPYRGNWRGAGRGYAAPTYGAPRGGVRRLDNRTRKVAVAGVEYGTEGDEALRSYLFNNYEVDSIEKHPEKADAQVVTFKERYVAEQFIAAGSTTSITSLGKLDLSWVQQTFPPPTSAPQSTADSGLPRSGANQVSETTNGDSGKDKELDMPDLESAAAAVDAVVGRSEEYDPDIADDTDRWMS